jgi:hypothetical protein
MKILNIESQIIDSEEELNELRQLLLRAKEDGIEEVHDHWGHRAWDTFTIDEAIKQFTPSNETNT